MTSKHADEPRCKHCWELMRFHFVMSVKMRCAKIRKMDTPSYGEVMSPEELEQWKELTAEL